MLDYQQQKLIPLNLRETANRKTKKQSWSLIKARSGFIAVSLPWDHCAFMNLVERNSNVVKRFHSMRSLKDVLLCFTMFFVTSCEVKIIDYMLYNCYIIKGIV